MSDTDQLTSYQDAIHEQYVQRATNLAAAREQEAPDFTFEEKENVVPDEVEDEASEDQGPPTSSWKKGEIVDYLLSTGVEVERDDLEAMTKAELLENFVADQG